MYITCQIGEGGASFPLDRRYEGRRGHSLLGTSAGGDSLAAAPPPFPPQSARTRGRNSPAMEATCTTAVHRTALAAARMAHRHARLRRAPPPPPPPPTATIPGGRGLRPPTSQLVPPPWLLLPAAGGGRGGRRWNWKGDGERPSRDSGNLEGLVRRGSDGVYAKGAAVPISEAFGR